MKFRAEVKRPEPPEDNPGLTFIHFSSSRRSRDTYFAFIFLVFLHLQFQPSATSALFEFPVDLHSFRAGLFLYEKLAQVESGNYNYKLDAVRVLDPSHSLRTLELS